MRSAVTAGLAFLCVALASSLHAPGVTPVAPSGTLRVGAAAVAITPFGTNPDWDGTTTSSGVWGERFTDANRNGHWDKGEAFEDDAVNTTIDSSSRGKYDGIFLSGFGRNRLATSRHDDYWARALVLDNGSTRIAIVALDLLGYYSAASYYGIEQVRRIVDPRLGIQDILVASTHNHEGPDPIGAWGPDAAADGKYPKYLRFVDRQIATSIARAADGLTPVRIKLGATTPEHSSSLEGLQTRTAGRPPRVFDDELRVMQFVATEVEAQGRTVATLVNWNTHPESMESENTVMTSDFPHAVRQAIEQRYGGTALYVSGAIGGVEIIGDTNARSHDRTRFDGQDFPLRAGRDQPVFTFERTEAIGRDVARAAIEALDRGGWSRSETLAVKKADLSGPMDNEGYVALMRLGVFDTQTAPADGSAPRFATTIYALTIGDAEVVTTPGELLPEVFLGVGDHRRQDCAAADTGRPAEPSIRQAMTGRYRFVFGLCPDELGYIVPGYDFRREPIDPKTMEVNESRDPCRAQGVPDHYHETNSASSLLAPASACVTVALLTGRLPADEACCDAAQYSAFVRGLGKQ